MKKLLLWAGPAAVPLVLLVLIATLVRLPPAGPPAAGSRSRYAALAAEAKRRVREITPSELKARLDLSQPGLIVIDVREDAEWSKGRIPGAIHVSRGILESRIEEIVSGPDALVVVYCHTGARTALAAESLRRIGYANVLSLGGGLKAWTEAGGEVSKG